MEKNHIKDIIKYNMTIVIILTVIEAIFTFVGFLFYTLSGNDSIISGYIFIIIIIGFLLLNTFLALYILRIKKFNKVTPIECVIEDFIYIGYVQDRKRQYKIAPIIRNTIDNKLYFTFGKYDLSMYTTVSAQMNNSLIAKKIVRFDGSMVNIGDTCYLYINKILQIKPEIDKDKNIIWLNSKKIIFINDNPKYDITIFNNLTYFNGLIDVEN